MKEIFKYIRNNTELIQAISALVVSVFAIFTFFGWRTSVGIFNEQKRDDLIQNRAYVSVNDAELQENTNGYTGWFSIVNEGKTPAYQVQLSDYYSSNQIKEIIGSNVDSSAGYLGPDESLKFSVNWSLDQVERILQNKDSYVIEIGYSDYENNICQFTAEVHTLIQNDEYQFGVKDQRETCSPS